MEEFYQLRQTLLQNTLIVTAIVFIAVWLSYSLNTALNYLVGAGTGWVYLRMLARDVESLGTNQQRLGIKGLGVFCVLIIVASRWQHLHILPVFLGFLTYKAAIIVYMLQTLILPANNR